MLRAAAHQASTGHAVAVLGSNPDSAALPGTVTTFGLDVPAYHSLRGMEKIRAAKNVLWSKPAAEAVDAALTAFRPDVIHLHNYAHQLSSSIISTIRSHGIPSVYTAHDYKLICPAYVANVDNKDCFSCATKLSPKLLLDKCHHDSLTWSSVVGVEAVLVRSRQLVPDKVIGPSKFMADSLKRSWIGRLADIELLRNPVDPTGQDWVGAGDYLLYVGRLSREKGVEELIKATASLGIRLVVAGDGPLRQDLEAQVRVSGARVAFVGHAGQEALTALRRDCIAQVVSSTWPENAPLSALEAAADGVPLIVTARGGLPEFAALGAKVAVIDGIEAQEISRALRGLPNINDDLEGFRTATSWETHVSELSRIYLEPVRVKS